MNETIPPPLPAPPSQPKTSALAIWSLVLGILSVVLAFCAGPLFFGIPAIICGHIAYSKIKNSGGQFGGSGLAIAGFACGYASLALLVLILPIAIPNFVKARDISIRNACINNLREIDAAKQQWALENNKTNGIPTAADISPYIKGGFESLHCPAGGTYTIGSILEPPTCSIPNHKLQTY